MERTKINFANANTVDIMDSKEEIFEGLIELYEELNPFINYHDEDILQDIRKGTMLDIMDEMEDIMQDNADDEELVAKAYRLEMSALNEILADITKILKRSRD